MSKGQYSWTAQALITLAWHSRDLSAPDRGMAVRAKITFSDQVSVDQWPQFKAAIMELDHTTVAPEHGMGLGQVAQYLCETISSSCDHRAIAVDLTMAPDLVWHWEADANA